MTERPLTREQYECDVLKIGPPMTFMEQDDDEQDDDEPVERAVGDIDESSYEGSQVPTPSGDTIRIEVSHNEQTEVVERLDDSHDDLQRDGLQRDGLQRDDYLREDEFTEPSVNTTEAEPVDTMRGCSGSTRLRSDSSECFRVGSTRGKRKKARKKAADRAARNLTNTGGSIKRLRTQYRTENGQGSLASGKKNTCLPDALYNALAAVINFFNIDMRLSLVNFRSIMPSDGSDPNFGDAKKLVEREGFSLTMRREFDMNPLALLKTRAGFYIVKLVTGYDDGRNDDEHFIAYDAPSGLLIDNCKKTRIVEVEDTDRSTKKKALQCFKNIFVKPVSTKIVGVYELTLAAPV